MALILWCAAGAPVVQGFVTGLGILALGLVFFPFSFEVVRPAAGQPMSGHARGMAAVRAGRWLAVPVLVCSVATLAGYVVIFVNAHGRFCNAMLTPGVRTFVLVWALVGVVTIGLLVVSATLRRRARRSTAPTGQ
ncbi:MAG TPA: hypothetical protein VJX10_17355 [Pseudonocardiaceae bacterium]|nr:hypothetical protein [Pseudonocardiaceae bacterium]